MMESQVTYDLDKTITRGEPFEGNVIDRSQDGRKMLLQRVDRDTDKAVFFRITVDRVETGV